MKIGYARVSTTGQSLESQVEELRNYGCTRIFQEKISTRKRERPELINCLHLIETLSKHTSEPLKTPTDTNLTLVVTKLDRLGRSIIDIKDITDKIKGFGCEFVSIKDNFDTSTATGKLIFHIIASFAEFERDVISERTKSALKYLKDSGKPIGRPKLKETEQLRAKARQLKAQGFKPKYIQRELGISSYTYYYYTR